MLVADGDRVVHHSHTRCRRRGAPAHEPTSPRSRSGASRTASSSSTGVGSRGVRAIAAKHAALTPRSATVGAMSRRGDQVVITNRKARHDYLVLETFECGIVLQGAEVKSIRNGRANLQDGYARVDDGEVWLYGMHVSPYEFSHGKPLDPIRKRKLLLHRREIEELDARERREGRHARPAARLLQGRPGQGRAGDRPRQGALRQAPDARRARREARNRAHAEGATAADAHGDDGDAARQCERVVRVPEWSACSALCSATEAWTSSMSSART